MKVSLKLRICETRINVLRKCFWNLCDVGAIRLFRLLEPCFTNSTLQLCKYIFISLTDHQKKFFWLQQTEQSGMQLLKKGDKEIHL